MRRVLPWVCALAALLLSFQGLTLGFGESDQGWSGAFYGQAVRALSWQDWGAMRPEGELYLDHPPGLVWLAWLPAQLLGHGPLAMRLIPWLFGGLAAAGVARLVQTQFLETDQVGPWPALAALAAIAHPAFATYASLPDPQGSLVWAGVLWACVAARLERPGWAVAAIAWTAWMDWPGLLLGACLALWAVLNKQNRNAGVYAGSTVLFGGGILAWIATLGGWPALWEAFLHRTGATGFLSEASTPMGLLPALQAIGEHHLWGATWPLTLLGVPALFWALRQRSILAIPACVGLAHVGIFLQGAAIHPYWQLYAVSGLSLLSIAFIPQIPARFATLAGSKPLRIGLPLLLLILLSLAGARSAARAKVIWMKEAPSRAMLRITGQTLAQETEHGERVHSPESRVPALAWHANRVIVWESTQARQVWRDGDQWKVAR